MELETDKLLLKKLLVDLEDEHEHLCESIEYLQKEVAKREIEIGKMLAESELNRLSKENTVQKNSISINFDGDRLPQYSFGFIERFNQLLDRITDTSGELTDLIKL